MKKFIVIIIILTMTVLYSFIVTLKYRQELQLSNVKIKNLRNTISELQQTENIIPVEKSSIDIKLDECLTENFMTAGMNNCTYEGIKEWNNEIEKYSNKIKKNLNEKDVQLFNKAQISWENYYRNEKIFLNNTIAQKDGDIHTTFVAGDLYELTKQRALLLKSYLMQLAK